MKDSMKKIIGLLIIIIMGITGYQYNDSTDSFQQRDRQEQSSQPSSDTEQKPSRNDKAPTSTHRSSSKSTEKASSDHTSGSLKRQTDQLKPEAYYYLKDDGIAYIHQYGHLPQNYISKREAEQQGWTPRDTTYVVGGNRFGNREGQLPKKKGRQYYEADVQAGYTDHRGPQRIVYSNDGLIFFTDDHYQSFQQYY